ncbi:MAG: DUF4238 domain-containing protein [Woeseiaceae bacterium]|nr:DUF4238 domain-containing protein [Woeseiaceae bacterium]
MEGSLDQAGQNKAMGQKRKRNHWVPQSYLRAFAADPHHREKIWRFSKDAGEPERKPIKNVAMRFHLYAPIGADGRRDYSFEARLSELENIFGDPLWNQLCTDMVRPAMPFRVKRRHTERTNRENSYKSSGSAYVPLAQSLPRSVSPACRSLSTNSPQTPEQVFSGRWQEVAAAKQRALDGAYQAHPERFVAGPPRTTAPPSIVKFNSITSEELKDGATDAVNFPTLPAVQNRMRANAA